MKNYKIMTIILILLIMVTASCKDKSISFKISGYVKSYSENGIENNSHQGIKIQLEGTSISTLSDKLGKYEIMLNDTGVYTILYSKERYGTYKNWYQLVEGGIELGGKEYDTIFIAEKSQVKISDLSITGIDIVESEISKISYEAGFDNYSSFLAFETYFHTNPNVSNTNYLFYDEKIYDNYEGNNITFFKRYNLSDYSGQTLFAIMYPKPYSFRGDNKFEYLNPFTMDTINPTFGEPSNIASFTIPSK